MKATDEKTRDRRPIDMSIRGVFLKIGAIFSFWTLVFIIRSRKSEQKAENGKQRESTRALATVPARCRVRIIAAKVSPAYEEYGEGSILCPFEPGKRRKSTQSKP
jgi:heme/copper-type cytochrome/quinol oxidase subunit 2